MANYVYNKIICSKEVLNKYFLDDNPFGDKDEKFKINPYITFNKLFNIKLDENYTKKYGESICYEDGFEYNNLENDYVEILFNTRWKYPIKAIKKSLELCKKDITWYVIEENLIYISKFYWFSGGNMDVITIASLVQHGLIMRDRIFTVSVFLPDKPGELNKVSDVIADAQGNIIKLEHNQFVSINRNSAVELTITMEAFGTEHKNKIIKSLKKAGYDPKMRNSTSVY